MLAAQLGQGLADALRPQLGTTTTTPGLQALQGDESGKIYDELQLAALKGFSHTPEIVGLQPIWGLFQKTKSPMTHRLHIKENMEGWARRNHVHIHKGIFFPKQAIEGFVQLRFNPTGGVAYFDTAERGISILSCRPLSGDDRESLCAKELAEEISTKNRSFAEALSLGKHDPRPPADN